MKRCCRRISYEAAKAALREMGRTALDPINKSGVCPQDRPLVRD